MLKRRVWVSSGVPGVVAAFWLGVAAAGSTAEGRPVRATAAIEERPVAGGGWLAWAQASRRRPSEFHVLARRGGGRAFRVNPPGTQALPGGIWRSVLVYEQRRRGDWDIELYDLARRKRLRPPRGVNTRHDETRASRSGDWFFFTREHRETREAQVLLRNLRTGEQMEVARVSPLGGRPPAAFSWQVNGRYAAASICGGGCTVLYDIAARKLIRPASLHIPDSAAHAISVAPNGTLYFARGLRLGYCSGVVELLSRRLGTNYSSEVGLVPAGIGVGSTYAVSSTGKTTVYYTRGLRSCGHNPDVYALDVRENPDPAPAG